MLVADDRIDRRVLDEARSLVRAGWDVTVISGPPPLPGDRQDEDSYPDINILRINNRRAEMLLGEIDQVRLNQTQAWFPNWDWLGINPIHNHLLVEAITRPAEIYVAHDLPQLPAAAMAACFHCSYLVYDSHELFTELYLERPDFKPQYTQVEAWLISFTDLVITVNSSIAAELVQRYTIPLPEVILNCPDVAKDCLPLPQTDQLRRGLGIPDGLAILLYQGNIGRPRNLENLVQAMALAEHQDIALVLMGRGDGLRKELIKIAESHHLFNRRIFFHEAVPVQNLLAYTASADAGIIPYPNLGLNKYYCTPNKLFEFIVAGLPILANDLPELNRFVGQQGIGMNLPMNSPEDIARSIDAFFSSDLKKFRIKAQQIAPQYVWQIQGQKVVELYVRLVDEDRQYPSIQARLQAAKDDIQQGRNEAAHQKLTSILQHNPNNIRALIDQAAMDYDQQRFSEALTRFKQVIAVNPGEVDAWVGLAMIAQRFGDQQMFMKAYQTARSLDPNNPKVLKLGTY